MMMRRHLVECKGKHIQEMLPKYWRLQPEDNSKSTFIYPGGDTRCIAEDSEYRFEVSKDSKEFHKRKVLLYFQGGGGYDVLSLYENFN